MTEFLKTVAQHYFDPLPTKSDGTVDYLKIADHLFVFPNRRAGLFFGQYIVDLNGGKPLFSPQMITIGDLFSLFSHVKVADRTTLLFRLYKIYSEVNRRNNPAYQQEPFDSFIFWGEMLLRDFDDVDRYLADAEKVFFNVRDLKEIEQRFGGLPPEVIDVIKRFWKNVNISDLTDQPAKTSFAQTWAILADVYAEFNASLLADGLAYEGMRQRMVVREIANGGCVEELKRLPGKVVLVGITAIDEAERSLLKWLKKNGRVEFCWDYGDERLRDKRQHASYFFIPNTQDFPNALTDDEQRAGVISDTKRRMRSIAVPSGVGQTAEASAILKQWGTEDSKHTAVVLADEKLLNSMLYSMPEEFDNFNVTMGYGLKSTTIYSLADSICQLQKNTQVTAATGALTFYYKTVLPILGHPFVTGIDPDVSFRLREKISRNAIYQVPVSELCVTEFLSLIFKPVRTVEETYKYLSGIFLYLIDRYKGDEIHRLDRETVIAYQQLLDSLIAEVHESGIKDLGPQTVMYLMQKLAVGQSLSFSGEPLSGLQVMGVLETRALDFRRIVFLSMNEGVVPAKPTHGSFIPNSLRSAFGLPTQRHRDSIFAYHFYRLLSRAEDVVFIYDNRTDGTSTGEPSRYLLQLEMLADNQDVKIEKMPASLPVTTEDSMPVRIEKTEAVMAKINELRAGGKRRISASSFKSYISCPMEYYLSSVLGLHESDELDDEMEDSQFGTIFHDSMQMFYQPMKGKMVTKERLENVEDFQLKQIISAAYQKNMGTAPLTGYSRLICEMVCEYMKCVIEHDKKCAPFQMLALEAPIEMPYKVDESLTVNLKAILDRVDIIEREGRPDSLRIIDYKTGSPSKKLDVKSISGLFDGEWKTGSREAFQVMLYCLVLCNADKTVLENAGLAYIAGRNPMIEPHLFFTRDLAKDRDNDDVKTIVSVATDDGGKATPVHDFNELRTEYETLFRQKVMELFDPQTAICQTVTDDNCMFCVFKSLCHKESDKKDK
ncbi:MAG: PD-(D/E)XK nuclease family protein [Bacteroidales bacterium]|nr:PD-(D/E)XK nuclease family protein [Candidatus Liminaster caballi]